MPGPLIPRFLRRALRRLLPLPPVDFVYSPAYAHRHPNVPADPLRGERILTFLKSEGLCRRHQIHSPRPATVRSLRRIHDDDYLLSLRDEEAVVPIFGGSTGLAELDRILEVQRSMAGGTNLATRLALGGGGLAVNLGGGLHHAWAARGQGFCVFNDVAVAIAAARAHGFDGRVLVVDLDLHHGDGTEAIFAEDSTVYTFSIHNRAWADLEAVASTRIDLGFEVEDPAYLAAVREYLPPIVESFAPELVFYLAGCDPAAGDTIGDWKISAEALLERDLFVLSLLRGAKARLPMVITLAGGYGTEAWRYSARFFGTLLRRGKRIEPPSTDEITLLRYRHIARHQDPLELTGAEPPGEDWGLTEEDILGPLAGPPKPTRFLGYYTRHGLELALERYGIFDRLRDQGFERPILDWDLDDISGQTVRVFAERGSSGDAGSEKGRRLLLGEVRARRDRRLLPGFETLHVEWLLLQNPRRPFSGRRRPLPGQEFPGLGLLRDIVSILIIACERLQLDGLSFVPSHFHLAVTSAALMRFLDPVEDARLGAARRALEGLDLAEASAAVEAGRVVDRERGEVYHWHPTTLVQPVSEGLEAYFESEEYQRLKAQAKPPAFELVAPPGDAATPRPA